MSPFAWIILAFIFLRLKRRRRWRMYHFAWHGAGGPPATLTYQGPPLQRALPEPSAFEQLKARYVRGEIGDEQYEQGLDALLKTPEGRGQMN